MRKGIFILFFILGLLFVSTGKTYAQTVNGDRVGPELPDAGAGQAVVCAHGSTGVAAVINSITDQAPYNTAPCAHVVLRLQVHAGDAVPDATGHYPAAERYASALNGSGSLFNNGGPTIVVVGVELSNLDPQGWGGTLTGNVDADLKKAAADYAKMFDAFSRTISDHNKFIIAPAPPDLYNSVYNAQTWMTAFNSNVNCSLVDTLVADIFKLDGVSNWLDIYHTQEQAMCGKKVTHFEGWGADPHASLKDQIAFLKTEPLPDGVNTGTTLIVNNCNGFGGNIGGNPNPTKPWLYWIAKTPDVVYNPDGTVFDINTCSSSSGATPVPFDVTKEVPCDQTQEPEWHSLRPYPASPCYKKVDETVLMCSNDLIVKKTFNLNAGGSIPGCTATCGDPTSTSNPDGSTTSTISCNYVCLQLQSKVHMDLTNAKLPIVGNTEDVPNATWTSPDTAAGKLTPAQKMNYYVSWYLNGVINRAEEDLSLYDKNGLTYAGPLNKLLPYAGQDNTRITSINNVHSNNPKEVRHNQIVGCPLSGLGTMIPCYLFNANISSLLPILQGKFPGIQVGTLISIVNDIKNHNRLTDLGGHEPPLESNYRDLDQWIAAWRQWLSNICMPPMGQTGLIFCINANANLWPHVFDYVPYSTTEDRLGLAFTDTGNLANTRQLPLGQGNGATVANVNFKPDIPAGDAFGGAAHDLYFAHMQEDSQLAKLLQNTFATKANPNDPNSWEGELARGVTSQQNANPYIGAGCVIQDAVANPQGDKLYGNIDRNPYDNPTDPANKVSGTLFYDANFNCNFVTTCKPDPFCIPGSSTCVPQCTTSQCNVDVYATLGVFTKTPKAYELWQRTVGCAPGTQNQSDPQQGPAAQCFESGGMSIFKRFYPKAGPNTALTTIKNIPGYANVTYLSDANGTYAGKTGTAGTDARIYFPYLGSMEEYFLKGIQKALRPQGMDNEPLPGQPSPQPSATPNTASIACPGPRTIDRAPSDLSCTDSSTYRANCNVSAPPPPAQWQFLKTGVHFLVNRIYSVSIGGDQIERCFNDVVDQSLAAGINPIYTLTIWGQESGASNYLQSHTCNLQDFGINTALAKGFQAQLTRFLGLPYTYPNTAAFSSCFPNNTCSIQGFSQVFQNGSCPIAQPGTIYAQKTIDNMNVVTQGKCTLPVYPTQMTTCQ